MTITFVIFLLLLHPKKVIKKRLLGDFLQELCFSDFLLKNVMFNLSYFLCINYEIY